MESANKQNMKNMINHKTVVEDVSLYKYIPTQQYF